MSLADIRSALKTTIEAVTDVGIVSDFDPLVTTEDQFRTFFFNDDLGYVLGWTITRERTEEVDAVTSLNWRSHDIVIKGYRGALEADGSATPTAEKDFQDMVEAVCVVLRNRQDDGLGGNVSIVEPPQVRVVDVRKYGDAYVVHYAEILVRCRELVATA